MDHTHRFVAKNQPLLHWILALDDVDVGSANRCGRDSDHRFSRFGTGTGRAFHSQIIDACEIRPLSSSAWHQLRSAAPIADRRLTAASDQAGNHDAENRIAPSNRRSASIEECREDQMGNISPHRDFFAPFEPPLASAAAATNAPSPSISNPADHQRSIVRGRPPLRVTFRRSSSRATLLLSSSQSSSVISSTATK